MKYFSTIMAVAAMLATGCYTPNEPSDAADVGFTASVEGYAVSTPEREPSQDMGLVLLENDGPVPVGVDGCTWTSALAIPQDPVSYVDVQIVDILTTQVATTNGAFFVGEVNTNVVGLQAGERVVFDGFPYDVSPGHRLVININQHGDGQHVGYGTVWLWW